jgi:selT/selW/selH-like putative selenoprotein
MKMIKPMVEVRIYYCVPCGYLGFAAWIAKEFYDEGGDQVAALLVPGLHGILQIEIAKEIVFDKVKEDQIPTPPRMRECRAILRAKIDAMNAARAEQLAANGARDDDDESAPATSQSAV